MKVFCVVSIIRVGNMELILELSYSGNFRPLSYSIIGLWIIEINFMI